MVAATCVNAALTFLIFISTCSGIEQANNESNNQVDTTIHKYTNRLAESASPYLKQHAHNPVDWYPWGEEAWEKAKKENKLVLVSIGYSACHWCHVMERESFEKEEVAELMNNNFVCIKVDREERPDVDQVYMNAVQIMTGSGGWPLNCFTLPDGRPIYGGTYYPKSQWMKILDALHTHYTTDPEKVLNYAEELTTAVKQSELVPDFTEPSPFEKNTLTTCVENWEKRFDKTEGGPNRVPKFPLPDNYIFLLRQAHFTNDHALLRHVELTLQKMAFGGIYDQVGGGFARYSTDGTWKVPHFEKMLYDNAQLVCLYAEAYRKTGDELYKEVVYETLEFIKREMTSPEGSFYSALDADSEGEEGKFYVWKEEEIKSLLGDDFKLAETYFNINPTGHWEHGNYILLRKKTDAEIANKFSIGEKELKKKIAAIKKTLLEKRAERIRPGLDNKILASWNALMISGYVQSYFAFGDDNFLQVAAQAAEFLLKNAMNDSGRLIHTVPSGAQKGVTPGFLEDYSFTIEALLALYQASANEKWLQKARLLADYTLIHFYDEKSAMFYFTSDEDHELIARKMEIQDNVIPSSNASMAHGLFMLGKYYDDQKYIEISNKMLMQVKKGIPEYGSGYSKWAQLLQWNIYPFLEIAIVGKDVEEKRKELSKRYLPGAIFVVAEQESKLPLLENKYESGKTLIYVCENKTCKRPTEKIEEALALIQKPE